MTRAMALSGDVWRRRPSLSRPVARADRRRRTRRRFCRTVNDEMLRLGVASQQAGWVYSTFITPDTEALNARASQAYIEAVARYAKEAARFDGVALPADERRQLDLLKLSLELVTPSDAKLAEEVTKLASSLEGDVRPRQMVRGAVQAGVVSRHREDHRGHGDVARSRAPAAGVGRLAHDLRADAPRLSAVRRAGEHRRTELGFADTGAMWRLKYDMPADEFTKEVDRLWEQVRPLYVSLHAYVRMKLHERYGDVVPATGPLPAHLLGNIWAQDWSNVLELVSTGSASAGYA